MKKKKLMAIAAVAVPIALLGAFWLDMLHTVKSIDITKKWGEEGAK